MPAEIITLCDKLVDDFQTRITVAGVLDTIVSRQYEVTYDPGTMTGRKVDIFPLMYEPIEDVDRESERYQFQVGFVVIERYRDKSAIPVSWVDERVNFVEEYIFNPLDNQTPYLLNISGVSYWIEKVKVASVYDYEFLSQNKLFWSEVEATFNRIATNL